MYEHCTTVVLHHNHNHSGGCGAKGSTGLQRPENAAAVPHDYFYYYCCCSIYYSLSTDLEQWLNCYQSYF